MCWWCHWKNALGTHNPSTLCTYCTGKRHQAGTETGFCKNSLYILTHRLLVSPSHSKAEEVRQLNACSSAIKIQAFSFGTKDYINGLASNMLKNKRKNKSKLMRGIKGTLHSVLRFCFWILCVQHCTDTTLPRLHRITALSKLERAF